MNRRVLLLSACLCLCLIAPALASAFDLGIGFKAGFVSPWYEGSDYMAFLSGFPFGPEVDFGASAGLSLTVGLSGFLCIQPEVFVSMLGGRGGDDSYVLDDQATALDVHLLLKLRLRGKRVVFCPFAGGTLFWELGEKSFVVTDKYYNVTVLSGYWLDDRVRVPVLGATAGAGLEWPRGPVTWSLDARYNLALQSRFTEASGWTNWYQRAVQLLAGVSWVVVGAAPRTTRAR